MGNAEGPGPALRGSPAQRRSNEDCSGDNVPHRVRATPSRRPWPRAIGITVGPTKHSPQVVSGRVAFDGKGIDRVEFLISTNPGEPLKPLARIASGGETARLMLALKSILAAADATPTLVFDEVDVGVGGRSGMVVGEKLWELSSEGAHQVICITHLPQIAAFAETHYKITKVQLDDRTDHRRHGPGRSRSR